MKNAFIIMIQFASLGLVAQISGLDLTVSGCMLIDPYLSSNDQMLSGQSVRDFSTGYSNLESNSLSGVFEADYTLFNKEWLHLRGRLSYGQLSASNEYQYYYDITNLKTIDIDFTHEYLNKYERSKDGWHMGSKGHKTLARDIYKRISENVLL